MSPLIDLSVARALNYILVITTIIFIATTVYFAIRKLEPTPETK